MYSISFFNALIKRLNTAADAFIQQFESELTHQESSELSPEIPERRNSLYGRFYELQCRGDRALGLCPLLARSRNDKSDDIIYEARELIALSIFPWLKRRNPSRELRDQLFANTLFVPFAFKLEKKKQSLLNESIEILLLPEDIVTRLAIVLRFRSEDVPSLTVGHLAQNTVSGDATCFTPDEIYLILFKLYLVGLIEKE